MRTSAQELLKHLASLSAPRWLQIASWTLINLVVGWLLWVVMIFVPLAAFPRLWFRGRHSWWWFVPISYAFAICALVVCARTGYMTPLWINLSMLPFGLAVILEAHLIVSHAVPAAKVRVDKVSAGSSQ